MKAIQAFLRREVSFGGFLILYGLFLWPLFLMKKGFTAGDYEWQFYPWAALYADHLKKNLLPLWTDLMQCGFPLFAEGQTAMLYGINLLLFKFLPFQAAYNSVFLVHYLLGGIGAYALARYKGLSAEASTGVALSFAFGSAYAGSFYNIASMRTLVWFPLNLLLIDLFLQKKKLMFLLIWAFVQGQVWLGGFPQTAAYSAFFTLLYYFLCSNRSLSRDLWVLSALGISLLIGLPQLWATWELALDSTRSLQDPEFALWGSAPPIVPLTLFLYPWSVFLRSGIYIGILPFLALLCLPKRGDWRFWVLAAIGFFLALGSLNPLYWLLIKIPGFSLLRNPSKFLFFTAFFLAILAGSATDALLKPRKEGPVCVACVQKTVLKWIGFFFALGLLGWWVAFFGKAFLADFGRWYVHHFVAGRSYHPFPVESYLQRIPVLIEIIQSKVSLSNPFFWIPFVWAGIFLFLLNRKGISKPWGRLLFLAVLIADLFLYGRFYYGTGFIGNLGPFPDLSLLEKLPRDGRWADLKKGEDYIFPPNRNCLSGHPHIGAYSPLLDKDYHDLVKDLGVLDDSFGRTVSPPERYADRKGLVDFLGLEYLAADSGTRIHGFLLMSDDGKTTFLRNPQALRKFNLVFRNRVFSTEEELTRYLQGKEFKPLEEAVTTKPLLDSRGFPLAGGHGTVRVNADEPLAVRLETQAITPSILVRSEVFDRGWKVWVDGKEAEIHRVNRAFQGVLLEPGRHRIEFLFQPSSFIIGLRFQLLGYAILILAGLSPLHRIRTESRGGQRGTVR